MSEPTSFQSYPEICRQVENINSITSQLQLEHQTGTLSRSWRETLYLVMDWTAQQHWFDQGPLSLNFLTAAYGENSPLVDCYLHASETNFGIELILKFLQNINTVSVWAITFCAIPIFLATIPFLIVAALVRKVLVGLLKIYAESSYNTYTLKAIADAIPPSVGRVETKQK